MPDRKPEPWESGAAAPFLWIETARGNVEMRAVEQPGTFARPPPGSNVGALARARGVRGAGRLGTCAIAAGSALRSVRHASLRVAAEARNVPTLPTSERVSWCSP